MRILRNIPSVISVTLAALFIMYSVSPYLSADQALRRAWVIYFLWLLTTLFWKRGSLNRTILELKHRRTEFFFLFCWLIIVLLNAAFDRGYTWDLHLLIMLTMAMIIIMGLCYSGQRDGSFELLLTMVIIFIGLEVLRSLPTLWSQPTLARTVMAYPEIAPEASSASVGQYGYYTGLAIVLPVIVTRTIVSHGRIKKIVLWILIAAIMLAVAISTFMGSILLMITGMLILSFFHIRYSAARRKIIIVYLAVGFTLFTVWSISLSEMPQRIFIEEKIADQFSSLAKSGIKEGDTTGRWDTWAMSYETIIEHPLIGIGPSTNRENPNLYNYIGGHSSWLDQSAEYGVLGFSFYLLFLFLIIKRLVRNTIIKSHTKKLKIVYAGQLVSCFLFVICGVYNPVVVIKDIFTLFYFMSVNDPNDYA